MSTHLLLEGTDLHELLAQVRGSHGEGARIVKAERIRSGGVAGFFSKERYEVTVEVPEGSAPAAPPVPAPAAAAPVPAQQPQSLGDLLAAADASDGADRLGAMIAAGAQTGPAAQTAPAADQQARTDLAARLESAFRAAPAAPAPAEVRESVDAAALLRAPRPAPAAAPAAAPHRPISTEGEEFAFALASMRRHLTDGTPADAPSVTPDVPSVDGAGGGRHAVPSGGPARRPTEDHVSADQYGPANGVSTAHRAGERAYAESAGHYPEPAEAPAEGLADHYGERFAPERRDAPRETPRTQPEHAEREANGVRTAYREDVTTYSERQAPRRAGYRTDGDPGDVLRLAREIDVPAPLRAGAGEVVLVVGETDAVVATSLLVADEVGSEAPLVMGRADVATTVTADELPQRQEQARRYSAPLTVALPARPTGADAERAARLAAAVGPAVVVVCVDATRRSHAVGALLRALEAAGVPARRLAVHRAAESPDPLDVLSLDVPVGYLDGRPATSGAWAGLLLDATSEPGGLPGR